VKFALVTHSETTIMETHQLRLPEGWIRSGATPELYEMGVSAPRAPALIASLPAPLPAKAFGTLMQSFSAAKYRGRRVRLRAELKTEDVQGAGTIWMRVDGAPGRGLRFDNMEMRKHDGVLAATSDWTRRDVVLDIPHEAESIHFGFFLRGQGRTWARKFEISEVGEDVPVTSVAREYPDEPTNLDFARLAGDG